MSFFKVLFAFALVAVARGQGMDMPMPMGAAGPAAGPLPPCVQDPTVPTCSAYTLPAAAATADLTSLCDDMPNMVGCSLWEECKSGAATGPYCAPFALLSTICLEMGGMRGCSNYNALCATADTVVEQCSVEKEVPNAPTTMDATAAVLEACQETPAPACAECTDSTGAGCPRPLNTLAVLCVAEPTRPQCEGFSAMCAAAGSDFPGVCNGAAMPVVAAVAPAPEADPVAPVVAAPAPVVAPVVEPVAPAPVVATVVDAIAPAPASSGRLAALSSAALALASVALAAAAAL